MEVHTNDWIIIFNSSLFTEVLRLLIFIFSAIECMGKGCNILVPEDFVQNILTNSNLRDKYQEYAFKDHVKVRHFQEKADKALYNLILILKRWFGHFISDFHYVFFTLFFVWVSDKPC